MAKKTGNPQLEDGYTKFSNELVEAFARSMPAPWRIMMAVIRYTWGWNLKEAKLTRAQLCEMTELRDDNLDRAVRKAVSIGLIKRSRAGKIYIYSVQKQYAKWYLPSLLTEIVTSDGKKAVTSDGKTPSLLTGNAVTSDGPTLLKKVKEKRKKTTYVAEAKTVLDYLNDLKGSRYERTDEIQARLAEGRTVDDCLCIIKNKSQDPYFQDNPRHLNPTTLFRKSHWDKYINDVPDSFTSKERRLLTVVQNFNKDGG